MPRTQANRWLAVATPLGDDVLLLKGFSGSERLGRLFEFNLDLRSEKPDIGFEALIGQKITVRMQLGEGATRYFNGHVCRFVQTTADPDLSSYSATVVPWLWFLTRTSDCRIFQNKTIPDIIKEVFRAHGFSDFKESLNAEYKPWDYCVQYRETDFNFVSRLMEQEGIYYYFTHENDKHTMVLADSTGAHWPYTGYETFEYRPPMEGVSESEVVTDWTVEKEVQPGAIALTDFDFVNPMRSLDACAVVSRGHAGDGFEMFDYPGEYDKSGEGQTYSTSRLDEWQAQYEVASASGGVRGASAGYKFTLSGYPREDQNREYQITSASFHAASEAFGSGPESGGESFSCSFTAIPVTQRFRLQRLTPRPVIQGPQTAMVVGKSGQEIWTDEHGRVKVKFHWDRYSKVDENSSCWIRVAQVWAGKSWGGIFIPRIGQEVIVEFLEGDPDQPIITGRVYNGTSKSPYKLPDNATRSALKSNSSKGGGGFNELRFEDKKGAEQVFIHAEKDIHLRVKNDRLEIVGNKQHLIVKKEDYQKFEKETHRTIVGDSYSKIGGEQHLIVDADSLAKIGGDDSRKVGGNLNLETGQGLSAKAGMAIHIKAGMSLAIEAGTQISLKVGGNFIDISPAGVAIQGTMLMLNSGGAAGACSPTAPVAPDPPTEPTEATTGEPGQVDELPPSPTPPQPKQFSSTALVLKRAAQDGTPLCEECEQARQQLQGGAQ